MKTPITILAAMILSTNIFAASKPISIEDNIKKLNWNGIEVVYIEVQSFSDL